MKERIKKLRKALNLTQSEFGNKIGATRDAVAAYERGVTIKEPIIKLICREFNVDPFWLETGEGDMFTAIPETIIDELVDEFKLDKYDRMIIQTYLEAPDEQQKAIKDFLLTLAENAKKKADD